MIVNPDKFQAIVITKNCRMKDSYALNNAPKCPKTSHKTCAGNI